MSKFYKLFSVLLLICNMSATAQTLVYSQAFTSGVTPTTECVAWNTFRATLLGTYSYTGFRISGSMNPVGIMCNDPVIALAVANALRTGTSLTIFDATATPTVQTWDVFAGCTTGLGCSSTPVEFGNSGTCTCAGIGGATSGGGNAYDVRPDIGNLNWGGIDGNTCGAVSQTMTVTFYAGPGSPTITGDSLLCDGETISLTATTTATSPVFAWTGPGGFTASTATITRIASPATAGIYSCTVTSGSITSSPTFDTITVVPQPVITPGAISGVCQGGTTATMPYSAAVSSPTNYSIAFSPAAISAGFVNVTGAALPVSPVTITVPAGAAAGTYSAVLTVSNSVCTGPAIPITVTINPLPAPITGYANACTGTTTTLSDATPGGTWSSGNPAIATIDPTTGVVTGVSLGSATMTYTLTATGCFQTINVSILGISGSNQVCVGTSVTLTSTSTGGTWTSSDVSLATVDATTGVVTGVSMGSIRITYTLGSGCNASWPMTVNPLAPILGRDSVCVGGVTYLTDIVGGGTWTTDYPAVATVLFDSGKVSGVGAGIARISYTLPTGCRSTRSVKVINNPPAITGPMQVCPEGATTLANTTSGGTWTSGNTGIATVSPGAGGTGVVTGVSEGTVNITYTISPGCPVIASVIVNPLPEPITGNSVLCPGAKDTVYDVTPGGLWSSGTIPVISIIDTNGAITAGAQGVSVIRYTLATGCFRTKSITVNPLPVPNIFYNFNTGTFEASAGFATYQWYDSIQGKIPFATTRMLAALNTEYYYVEVTDGNGCKGKSAKYYFDIKQLGVNDISQGQVKIYPNPASTTVHIESAVKVRAVISSVEGKKIIDQEDAKEINISKLAGGVYVITLFDELGIRLSVQKLVKE